ncbi:nucleotidyltransferase domain-containing protein [Bacillus spizizenii]|nr:nucleotidyltransferase domain-containing protein [Bacillus spizizenii]
MEKLNLCTLLLFLDIEKIVLFGNRSSKSKDIDLLIISDDFDSMYSAKRINYVARKLNVSKKLDLICLTLNEYHKMKKFPTEFSKQILLNGEIIYEKRTY